MPPPPPCPQDVPGVTLGGTAEESAAVPTTDTATACTEAASALRDFTVASATCVSSGLILSCPVPNVCVQDEFYTHTNNNITPGRHIYKFEGTLKKKGSCIMIKIRNFYQLND